MADKRITPARADLAAAHLKGAVDAPRYAEGSPRSVWVGRTSLRTRPSDEAPQDSELLYGESFTVYDFAKGWAWGQAANDSYVGYVDEKALTVPFKTEGRIAAQVAPTFLGPDLKRAVQDLLPLNSAVRVLGRDGDYVEIESGLYVHHRHLEPATENDFVAVAQRFVGVPYVWGGKTYAGLDCSGLIQTALAATGMQAPRDTDMMAKALGQPIATADRRGDLVFWKGHMGVMVDGEMLLHANAFHMATVIEPLAQAVARIAGVAGPVTGVRRL
ncbi:MAG: peptidase [Alphaproteobacteria bacterium]|nr:peptidase [Alphaproteobacteria bacterium]